MHLVKGTFIAAVALAGTLAASGLTLVGDGPTVASADPPAEQKAADQDISILGGCDRMSCGSNSERLFGTPFGALHLGGRENSHGFRIDPILYKPIPGQRRPEQYQLGVEQGAFVGKHPVTRKRLEGSDLEGSWFILRKGVVARQELQTPPRRDAMIEREWKIVISQVAMVPLFAKRPMRVPVASRGVSHEYAFAYQLELPDEPSGSSQKRFLCGEDSQSGLDRSSFLVPGGVSPVPGGGSLPVRGPGWGLGVNHTAPLKVQQGGRNYRVLSWLENNVHVSDAATFAVLVKGEVYDASTAAVTLSKERGRLWFNIGCAGTALAKMKLMGYDPEETLTEPEQRQATLRMITARYCGDQSFTEDHVPLVWQNASDWFQPETTFDVGTIGKIEAAWDKDGAICLNEPRLATREEVIQACGSKPRCDASGNPMPSGIASAHSTSVTDALTKPQVNNPAGLRLDKGTLDPAAGQFGYLHRVPAGAEWVTRHRAESITRHRHPKP